MDQLTILTAGHCFLHGDILDTDPGNYTITVGTLKAYPPQGRDIPDEIILFPGYSYNTLFDDDIAIIKLKRKLVFSTTVKPACFPTAGYNKDDCYLSGWGLTRPQVGVGKISKIVVENIIDSYPSFESGRK